MEHSYPCSIIKDLLPQYYDDTTSDESNQIIEAHLKECQDCKQYFDSMKEKEDNLPFLDTETIRYTKIAKKIKIRKIVTNLFTVALILCISTISVRTFRTTVIMGNCMEPTISNGEKYIINRLAYKLTSPKSLDIIIYKEDGIYCISRIIATPNDTVKIDSGDVFVNDKQIDYDFLPESFTIDQFTVKEDEYFILADNTNSASIIPQFVSENEIVGKVILTK